MKDESVVNFKEAKRSRNELELPNLHFIVVDDWIDVIGERALMAWLRMYSWCDRSDKDLDVNEIGFNVWEQASIPVSLNSTMKKLGVSRATFYNKILKPLWNVGLIDIEEFKNSKSSGVKPLNIIVYKYPQNDFSLAVKPLKEVRNYDKEYKSDSKKFAKKGGRPKKEQSTSNAGVTAFDEGVVQKENHGWFKNKTGDGLNKKPINSLNSLNNSPNSINNNLDTIDTLAEQSKIPEKMNSAEKERMKERYFEKGFYGNYELVPKEISNVLEVFCSTKEAKEYYHILLLAKKKIEVESNSVIWLEESPDLIDEIVNTFSRSIRKVEQEQDVDNRKGYFYKAFYKTISDYVSQAQRLKNEGDNHSGVYFDWLEDSVLGD